MAGRRLLLAIVVLSASLHAIGIARAVLPAQDGLKFLRVARQFQTSPWIDVVRGTDQHPLYPALVALAEPAVSTFLGEGPTAWRVSGALVSSIASVALLFPLFGLVRALFDERIALLAALIYAVLPLPGEVGHDTLSDSLALLAFVTSLRLGERALHRPGWLVPAGCGLVAGLGFLTRPEVLVAPAAVLLVSFAKARRPAPSPEAMLRLSALAVSFLAMVGGYAIVKGEVSEKLALRGGVRNDAPAPSIRSAGHPLPKGLDDPRWDFSPKEEAGAPSGSLPALLFRLVVLQWAEAMAGVFAFFAAWGLVRDRAIRGFLGGEDDPGTASRRRWGRLLMAAYLILFAAVLARHVMRMGYLSGRHTLTLVIVSVPWAAAGIWVCGTRLAGKRGWESRKARRLAIATLTLALGLAIAYHVRPGHPSRWGHWAAGRWLAEHARPGEAVLDTRGWASFVSQVPSYDYWHVRQAFTDHRLAYIVVGTDELEAPSRRAATLRAVLAHSSEVCAEFPAMPGGEKVDKTDDDEPGERAEGDSGVRIYHFRRPDSWEGLTP